MVWRWNHQSPTEPGSSEPNLYDVEITTDLSDCGPQRGRQDDVCPPISPVGWHYLPLADPALLYGATSWPPELVVEWNHAKSTILNPAAYEKVLSKVNRT